MKFSLRAVLFDVYHTLLEIGPAPADAAERWDALCKEFFSERPGMSLPELSEACRVVVKKDHALARQAGIQFPEVDWPHVLRRALEPASRLESEQLSEFIFRHVALLRTSHLMPGAAEVLRHCRDLGILCGIVSNAQAYTLRELSSALEAETLDFSLFDPNLVFWSFENGFSKPDPHVFRLLSARVAQAGIAIQDTLIIGDREDNDIVPAAAWGFQTYRFVPLPTGDSWPEIVPKI